MKTTILLAFFLVPFLAFADDNTMRQVKVLERVSKAYTGQVQEILGHQQRQLDAKCPLRKLEADNLVVVDAPEFNLDGIPEHGRWMVSYEATACKQAVRRTVLFEGTKKGVNIEAGPPGATLADPMLAKDVWSSFRKAAVRQEPACDPAKMVLMRTEMVEAPSTANPYWREAWMGRVCGKEMGQIVSFYPSKAGTVFRMSLPEQPVPEKALTPAYGEAQ